MITTNRERLKTNTTFYIKRGEPLQSEILCCPQERGTEPARPSISHNEAIKPDLKQSKHRFAVSCEDHSTGPHLFQRGLHGPRPSAVQRNRSAHLMPA